MAFIELTHGSSELGKQTQVNILLPDKLNENVKILYLLHGLSDNNTSWVMNTSISRYAKQRNLAVVMPDGGKSFYHNMLSGYNYFNYIAKELQEYVEKLIPFSGKSEDRYIAGLSMGGYGAFKFALTNPERYAGAAAFSGVMDIKSRYETSTFDFSAIFPNGVPNEADLFYLSQQAQNQGKKPKLYQWCGLDDFLYEDNVKFREYIKNLNFEYTYSEYAGSHDWARWDEQIAKVMDFFNL